MRETWRKLSSLLLSIVFLVSLYAVESLGTKNLAYLQDQALSRETKVEKLAGGGRSFGGARGGGGGGARGGTRGGSSGDSDANGSGSSSGSPYGRVIPAVGATTYPKNGGGHKSNAQRVENCSLHILLASTTLLFLLLDSILELLCVRAM